MRGTVNVCDFSLLAFRLPAYVLLMFRQILCNHRIFLASKDSVNALFSVFYDAFEFPKVKRILYSAKKFFNDF